MRPEQLAWLLLLAAGSLEVVWALALDHADGFTRLWPSLLGVAAAIASVVLLTISLRELPVGTAYAVWTGIGAAGVTIVGIIALAEPASAARLACLCAHRVGGGGVATSGGALDRGCDLDACLRGRRTAGIEGVGPGWCGSTHNVPSPVAPPGVWNVMRLWHA